jgi:Helix-turn-helix domain of resolvase
MLGVFAEFETNLRRERQLEGIAKAKAAGVYNGRPASIDMTKVRQMKAQGIGASEIAKALKIGRASVYRALGAARHRAGPPWQRVEIVVPVLWRDREGATRSATVTSKSPARTSLQARSGRPAPSVSTSSCRVRERGVGMSAAYRIVSPDAQQPIAANSGRRAQK